jgi:MFS family permease
MCVLALLLAALVHRGDVQYWHVAVVAGVYGVANTVDMPTRQAFIVEMVGRGSLRSAIALNSAMFNAARVVGPALALQAEGRPRADSGRRLRDEIAEGGAVRDAHAPHLARDILNEDAHGFGLLMTAVGCGAVVGATVLASVGAERPPVPVLVGSAAVLGAATMLMAGVHHFAVAAALLAIMGFSGMLFMTGASTTVQLTVPDDLRGRVMSLHTLMFAGMVPFGALLIGSGVEALGTRAGFLVTGAPGSLAVAAVTLGWRRYRRRR